MRKVAAEMHATRPCAGRRGPCTVGRSEAFAITLKGRWVRYALGGEPLFRVWLFAKAESEMGVPSYGTTEPVDMGATKPNRSARLFIQSILPSVCSMLRAMMSPGRYQTRFRCENSSPWLLWVIHREEGKVLPKFAACSSLRNGGIQQNQIHCEK